MAGLEESKIGIVVWDARGHSWSSASRVVVSRTEVPSRAVGHTLLLAPSFPSQGSKRSLLLFAKNGGAGGERLMAPFFLPTAGLWGAACGPPAYLLTAAFVF